ncbi:MULTISPECIES: sugar phosphate isomerase/epimerase [unclassified Sporosarcina]|uniref:sugar phosphate isomerase/epimerase family protein n=1 Tax=unclassified Sporosarcina TaxID=2647733 RepID=UPI00203ECAEF|nr:MULTISPECIES: sugar phosphate isomerase/epimerase [unclassified Sporosarcina]GKV65855.1 epimerase [Sporosarcina sp. NCCP-2331]GLB55980.1 epimerase [Sporosarcina sp. NCCP-2378]
MNKISVCSWIFGDQPIEKTIRTIDSLGYQSIEIAASEAVNQTSKIKSILKDTDLIIGGMTGDASWPDETKDLSNHNSDYRNKAVSYFQEQIKTAGELAADYIVICPSAVGKITSPIEKDENWQRALDSVKKLSETAAAEDIDLIIEPINRYESSLLNSANDACRFVSEIKHTNVKMLVDTFHMNLEEEDLIQAIFDSADQLAVFHVADNNRKGLGMGHLDFPAIFTALKTIQYDGPVVLECLVPSGSPFEANSSKNLQLTEYLKSSLKILNQYI